MQTLDLITDWARSRYDAKQNGWALDWQALGAYLLNDHLPDTRAHALRLFPRSGARWSQEGCWRFFPLVTMFAQRLSVTFDVPPSTYLRRKWSQERLPETHPQVMQWREDEGHLDLAATLQELELRTTALDNMVVHVAWMGDHVEWHQYMPGDVRVLRDRAAPGAFERSPAVGLRLRSTEPDGSARPDEWLCWCRNDSTGTWEAWVVSDDGRPLRPVYPDGINPYRRHPVVLWRWRVPEQGELFVAPSQPLLSAQRSVNVQMTDIEYGLRYNAHPVRVTKGNTRDRDDADPAVSGDPGVETHFMGTDGDLQFRTPDLNSEEHRNAVEFGLQLLGVTNGLPPDTFSAWSPTRNLGAKKQEMAELKRLQKRRRPLAHARLAQTFEVHKAVANLWADVSAATSGASRVRYDADVELAVDVVEYAEVEDRQSDAQATQVELDALLTSPIEEIMRRLGVTRPTAERLLEERKATAA